MQSSIKKIEYEFKDLSWQEDERTLLARNRIFLFWVRTPTASHPQFDYLNRRKSSLPYGRTDHPKLEPKKKIRKINFLLEILLL